MLEFLGIGAQKAGTSWLHLNLARHPALWLPPEKELHFWDRHRHHGIERYQRIFDGTPPGVLGGEITPAYGILGDEPIGEVRAHFPDLKLLYCIRNPIDRAWSSALMALAKAEMTIDEASDRWFLDHFASSGSRRRGDYEACLRAWLRHFPADRLLIVRFEEIHSDPRSLLVRCAQHLEVDTAPFHLLPFTDLARPVNAGPGERLRSSLRAALEDMYFPKIERLESFLGADLSGWRHPLEQGES